MILIEHIKELLVKENNVVLPELGAFETIKASAEIHPVTHSIQPPHKEIKFNEHQKTSNGFLEKALMEREGITEEEAQEQIKQFVSALKIELGIHKSYIIPELGELNLKYEDKIGFIPFNEVNYLDEGFGLPELFARPVERGEKKEPVSQQISSQTTDTEENNEEEELTIDKKKINWGAVVAISTLVLLSSFVGYVLFIDNSLNPFKSLFKSNTETYTIKDSLKNETTLENTETTTTDSTDNTSTTETTENTETSNTENNNTSTKTPLTLNDIIITSKQNKYFVVIGSFGNQANAYRYANQLLQAGNKTVRVVAPFGNQNLHRVCIESFGTEEAAENRAEVLKATYGQGVWVLSY